ncbi:MAG: IS30 family transposase [Lachnospiraceae bacterium]|nr:IS30 family transposase [Lachnospiraceae bacterium]
MKHKYLTERERYQIEILLKQKTPKTQIAKILGISRTTLYNEIKRGSVIQRNEYYEDKLVYKADAGQRVREENGSNKGRPWKIENDYDFVKFVEYWICEMRYSPYAVIQQMKRENKHFKTNICEKTLYNYIHQGVFLNVSDTMLPYQKRKKKQNEIIRKVSLKQPLKPSIENRPKEIYKRDTYGHWEMDTVYSGRKNAACLLVLTERQTRDEIVIKLNSRKADCVRSALLRLKKNYGAEKFRQTFKTITCDNGVEFTAWEILEKKLDVDIYFCHPYCSCERGSNENNNKLIRRWIKKGEDIGRYKNRDIKRIENWMNDYPRRMFGGLSSREYSALCTKTC